MSDDLTKAAPAVVQQRFVLPCAACGAEPAPEPASHCWWCGKLILTTMKTELTHEPNVKLRPLGKKYRKVTRKELAAVAHSLRLRNIHIDWLVAAQRHPVLVFVDRLKKVLWHIFVDSWYQSLVRRIKRISPAKNDSIGTANINGVQNGQLEPIFEIHGADALVGSHGQNIQAQAPPPNR